MVAFRYGLYVFFLLVSLNLTAQTTIFYEDFNDCELPEGWMLEVTNGQDDGVIFGTPLNENSDSTGIDGSCMVMFDDDILGNNMPEFTAELFSPNINIDGFTVLELSMDVHFRAYQVSTMQVLVRQGADEYVIRLFDEDNQTGNQFSQFVKVKADISMLAGGGDISIGTIYSDGGIWAWWGGLDNVMLEGRENAQVIWNETFDACEKPAEWTTEIKEGEHDWQFGFIENSKSSSNSMNGSCFAFFDDDGIGKDVPFSTVDLISPVIDGTQYAQFFFSVDLIFRKYADFENVSIYVYDGKEYYLVNEYILDVGGPQFNEYVSLELDLTKFRKANMQIVIRYEDGDSWGWWTGVDNAKLIGQGDINDVCVKAIPLTIGPDCVEADNSNAIFDGPESTCSASMLSSLWYMVQPDQDGLLQITTKGDYNDVITVFSGACSDLNEVICSNRDEHGFEGESIVISATANEIYYIRTSGVDDRFGKYQGSSCLSARWIPEMPGSEVYDIVENAIVLNLDESCDEHANNYRAELEAQLPSLNELARADIWYSFNSGDASDVMLETDADFSDIITIYQEDNGSMKELQSNPYGRKLKVKGLLLEQDYYVQLAGGFSTIEGMTCLTVNRLIEDDPQNDDCVDAEVLSIGESISIATSGNELSGPYPECDVYADHDAWVRFVATSDEIVELSTSAFFIHNVAIYYGKCDSLIPMECFYNPNACDGPLTISGLESGETYWVQLSSSETYNEGNSGPITISLNEVSEEPYQPLGLTVSVICAEDGPAQLFIQGTGGEGSYQYQGHTSNDFFYSGDEYLVIVTDGNGCEVSKKGKVNCNSSLCALELESEVADVRCGDSSDGYIQVNLLQGVAPFTYIWSDNVSQNDIAENLETGNYSVTVIDDQGCEIVESFEINAPVILQTGLTVMDESYAMANDGQASLTIDGGAYPYIVQWSHGAEGESVADLAPGAYTVTITDAYGCEDIHAFDVAAYNCAFVVTETVTMPLCHGGEDGIISLEGNQSIVYAVWDHGVFGKIQTNLSEGTYMVTVTSTDGCSNIMTIEVNAPEELIVSDETIINVSCNGANDGSISLGSSGGTGNVMMTWSDGVNGPTRNELPPGMFEVELIDDNGCIQTASYEISEPAVLQVAAASAEDVSCYGMNDGTAMVLVEGGTEPYSFDWGAASEENLSKIQDLPAGDYPVVITDDHGCVTETTVSVVQPEELDVALVATTFDPTSELGTIDIDVSGGVGPMTFEWLDASGNEVSTDEDPVDLAEGLYTVWVTDDKGCTYTSEEILLMVSDVTEIESLLTARLSPNPATDLTTLHIESLESLNLNVSVLNAVGEVIKEVSIESGIDSRTPISLLGLTGGVYLVEIESEKGSLTLPLTVVR